MCDDCDCSEVADSIYEEMHDRYQPKIDALVAALEAMRKEFRDADLPYGSKAYLQSGEALALARGEG